VSKYRADDVDLLLPSFRQAVRDLLQALTERGFKPIPRDTLRTAEEALRNAKKGVGIVDSIHCHGAAVDVICDEHGWDCAANGCEFYAALGEIAEAMGLVWGGRWKRRDLPHVQAIEVRDQNALRALTSWEAKDAFVGKRLQKRLT
jgi:hypothetical protein